MKFALIAAADDNMGIGIKNRLPWRLKDDLRYFSEVTTEAPEGKKNTVIMGRNTWLSLPEKSRPLSDRLNVVLSREELDLPEGVLRAVSFHDAFRQIEEDSSVEKVFVIGGANVYAQAIKLPDCDKIYLTHVKGSFQCDTYFPPIDEAIFQLDSETEIYEENGFKYSFKVYRRIGENCTSITLKA